MPVLAFRSRIARGNKKFEDLAKTLLLSLTKIANMISCLECDAFDLSMMNDMF